MTRSPLWPLAGGFALGIALAPVSGATPAWAIATGAACLLAAGALRKVPAARRGLLFVALVGLGAARQTAIPAIPDWLVLRAPRITEITGTLVSYPSLGQERIRFVVRPDHLPSCLLVTWECPGRGAETVFCGDRVVLVGRVEREGAFGGFDYGRYLERQGIFATMRVAAADLAVVGARPSVFRVGDRVRQSLLASLERHLDQGRFALAQSYVFGDRYALSDETEEAFVETGLMHILAVSGMHLTVLLAGVWWCLRALGVRPALAYPILAVLVLAAVWIIGPWISFARSALLFFFIAAGSVLADLGFVLRGAVRPMNALAGAAFALLAVDPQALHDIGFQLSVSATAGLLVFSPPRGWPTLDRWPRGVARAARAAISIFAISLAAQAGAAPVIALHFEKVQVWTAATGIVVLPLASLALWLGVAALTAGSLGPLASLSAAMFGMSLDAFEGSVRLAARLPWSRLPADGRVALWLAALVLFLHAARGALAAAPRLPGEDALRQPDAAQRRRPRAVAADPAMPENGRQRLTGGRRDSSLVHHDADGERVPDWSQPDPAAYAEAGEALARALRVVLRRLDGAGGPARGGAGLVDAGRSRCLGAQRHGDR